MQVADLDAPHLSRPHSSDGGAAGPQAQSVHTVTPQVSESPSVVYKGNIYAILNISVRRVTGITCQLMIYSVWHILLSSTSLLSTKSQ